MNEMKLFCLLLLLLLLCLSYVKSSLFPGLENPRKLSHEAQELFDAFWKWKISGLPQSATYVGIHDYDALLDDVSEAANLARFEKCHEFLAMANELEPSLTDEADIINLKVLKYELETFINFYDLKGFYLTMNYMEGPQVHMDRLFDRMLLNTYEDYDVMIRRLEKLSLQIDQIIDVMKAGVLNNITYHEVSMQHLNQSIGKFVVEDPTEFPLYSFFRDGFPANFTPEHIAKIQEKAQAVILQKVSPAYKKLLDYILNEYVTREDIAITSIHRGNEFYDSIIWFHTSTNYTAKEIQNIGFSEVERIEGEMKKIIVEMGYENMTTREFSDMIRDDPNNYYNNSDDLIEGFRQIVHNLVPPRMSLIFRNIPKAELRVADDPAPYKSGAYYVSGSYDGSRPGVFYVRTHYLDSQPKYTMLSLSLHEGYPGHHFERSRSNESPDLPFFRKRPLYGKLGISPSRLPTYTYYVEGWGLYSESLGFDMNLYSDPLERYGHYNEEILRACRLVVDTGMHALGWTREEAIDYMFNHTAMSKSSVENEIDRYITWPGQALAYKIGQLKIQELRKQAEQKLGNLFDIKDFHEVVLNSFGSMDILEDQVQKWINRLI